ncbi:hypothetical protein SKAU_G00289390 [Synaphobranchus kaupii]|uniref:Ig-like domain-containing protein n=1 Tax=Synaphobranchus kaupii TaxID=118154 RepID=A0A9Q1ETD9_SYNKA|nr:hypothetical protein SKAU_G00289390 [Synaphobranchus kaupii]
MLGTLCTLITVLSCVSGQTLLTQKPSMLSLTKGQTATLDCNISPVDTNNIHWYKQVPGSAPQFVLYFYRTHGSPTYGAGFSSNRFTSRAQSTKLIVTDSSLAAPTLSLLPPSSEELKTQKATLVCLAQTSVLFADVTWTSDGSRVTDGVFTSAAEPKPDKTFGLSSFLTITPSEWISDRVFTCKVSVGSETSEISIKKSDCSE